MNSITDTSITTLLQHSRNSVTTHDVYFESFWLACISIQGISNSVIPEGRVLASRVSFWHHGPPKSPIFMGGGGGGDTLSIGQKSFENINYK